MKTAAKISLFAGAGFLVLLVILHFVKPELDPSWRMISEYSMGANGWLMRLAFLCFAASAVGLFVAVRQDVQTVGGKIGLGVLLLVALGVTIAAAFNTDPITAGPDELTTHGNLHGLGAMLGIPTLPIAALLISRSLGRNPLWENKKRALNWIALSTLIALVLFGASVGIMLSAHGKFGPDVLIGWPNRILMLVYLGWIMYVARLKARQN